MVSNVPALVVMCFMSASENWFADLKGGATIVMKKAVETNNNINNSKIIIIRGCFYNVSFQYVIFP